MWTSKAHHKFVSWHVLAAVSLLFIFVSLLTPTPAFASTTTFSAICTSDNGSPQATLAISWNGAISNVSPATVACDGSSHTETVTYSGTLTGSQITFTEPADGGNTRYRFGGALTYITLTCTTSCPTFSYTNYYELEQTFVMTPGTPSTWDNNYGPFNVLGAVDSNIDVTSTWLSSTICQISLTSSSGSANCSGWVDFNRLFHFVAGWKDNPSEGQSWGASHTSFTWSTVNGLPTGLSGTSGGSTFTVTYSTRHNVNDSMSGIIAGENDWYHGVTDIISGIVAGANDWYHAVTEIISGIQIGVSHYVGVPSESAWYICGNHTVGNPLCAIQPVKFTPTGGVSIQTVSVSGCPPNAPPTVLGDGQIYNVQVGASCLITFTLPVGYVWVSTGSQDITHTSCASGTCTLFSADYSAAAQYITCNMDNGATQATLILSGAGIYPTSLLCDGVARQFVVIIGNTITATEPTDNPNSRYRFAGGGYTTTHTSAADSWVITNYEELQNRYEMAPGTPSVWDGVYSESVTGTVTGTVGSTVCSIALSNGGGIAGCTGWADYNYPVSTVTGFASVLTGSWSATGTHSWSDIAGGYTHTATYDLLLGTVTENVTITVANSGPSGTATVSGCSASVGTIAMDGSSHSFTVATLCTYTITVPSDGTHTRYRFSFSGVPSNTQSQDSTALGPDTFTYTVYYQLLNSYECVPQSPAVWDGVYACASTGTFLGTGSYTVSTVNTANGGGTVVHSGWADYNQIVSLPSIIHTTWVGQGTKSFQQTTGGNTNIVDYIMTIPPPPPHIVVYSVVVETNPSNLQSALIINGTTYPHGPVTLVTHYHDLLNIEATSTALGPQMGLLHFLSWSNGGTRAQTYTVTTNATLLARFATSASTCATYGTNLNAMLNNGCEWGVVFFMWFSIFGPWILAFICFLPALAVYMRTESPAASVGIYVVIDVVIVSGMSVASIPASLNTVAPGLLGAVIAGSIFQLIRSNKGG